MDLLVHIYEMVSSTWFWFWWRLFKLLLISFPYCSVSHHSFLHSNLDFIFSYSGVCFETCAHDHTFNIISILDYQTTLKSQHTRHLKKAKRNQHIFLQAHSKTYTLNWIVNPLYIGDIAYPAPPNTAEKIPHYKIPSSVYAHSKLHEYENVRRNGLTFAAPTTAPLPPSQAASLASSEPRPPVLLIIAISFSSMVDIFTSQEDFHLLGVEERHQFPHIRRNSDDHQRHCLSKKVNTTTSQLLKQQAIEQTTTFQNVFSVLLTNSLHGPRAWHERNENYSCYQPRRGCFSRRYRCPTTIYLRREWPCHAVLKEPDYFYKLGDRLSGSYVACPCKACWVEFGIEVLGRLTQYKHPPHYSFNNTIAY